MATLGQRPPVEHFKLTKRQIHSVLGKAMELSGVQEVSSILEPSKLLGKNSGQPANQELLKWFENKERFNFKQETCCSNATVES